MVGYNPLLSIKRHVKLSLIFFFRRLSLNFFIAEVHIIIETSPFICRANQWTGFFMIGTSVVKKLTALKFCIT